jgi:hypothetical protein
LLEQTSNFGKVKYGLATAKITGTKKERQMMQTTFFPPRFRKNFDRCLFDERRVPQIWSQSNDRRIYNYNTS